MSHIAIAGTGGGSGLTVGSTTIAGGTSGRLLYDAAGVLGETPDVTYDLVNDQLAVPQGSFSPLVPGLTFDSDPTTGLIDNGSNLGFLLAGNLEFNLSPNQFRVRSDSTFSFSSSAANLAFADVGLVRTAASVMAVLNPSNLATSPATFQVYNNTDSASAPTDYMRGVFGWAGGGTLLVGTQSAGASGTANWQMVSSGGQVMMVSGAVNLIGMNFDVNTNTGFSCLAQNFLFWESGTIALVLSTSITQFRIPSNFEFSWASSTNNLTVADTALARNAAGIVEVNNGTAGTLRDITVRDVYTNDASFLIRAVGALNNGAGTGSGVTFTNAPGSSVVTGNPTKWIPVDDAGTTRYIPAF